MSWLYHLEQWVVHLSMYVPLPLYIFAGEIIEEIVSPIPSQAILITGGSIAQAQGWPIISLLLLAAIATFAKTTTTLIYYFLARKLEDRLIPLVGKYIRITEADLEAVARRLNQNRSKEFLSLFVARCLPILPSAPVSVICGLLKINVKTFFLASLAGNFLRGFLVLLTGYLGFDVVTALANGGLSWKTLIFILVVIFLIGFFSWGYWKRYKNTKESSEKK